jgi:hypothetical protein
LWCLSLALSLAEACRIAQDQAVTLQQELAMLKGQFIRTQWQATQERERFISAVFQPGKLKHSLASSSSWHGHTPTSHRLSKLPSSCSA